MSMRIEVTPPKLTSPKITYIAPVQEIMQPPTSKRAQFNILEFLQVHRHQERHQHDHNQGKVSYLQEAIGGPSHN